MVDNEEDLLRPVIDEVHLIRMRVLKDLAHLRIAIYMDYDYWQQCRVQRSKGRVSPSVHEFHTKDTIVGYPVWKVLPPDSGDRHPNFLVVDLSADD